MIFTCKIKEYILSLGADLVGFADMSQVPAQNRCDLPYGIAIAIALNSDIAKNIPTQPIKKYMDDYLNEYETVTQKLDDICELTAKYIDDNSDGKYKAIAQTRNFVGSQRENMKSKAKVPHKTVAALSGFGWIGKSSLLITPQYGSALRLTSVLTDAPIEANKTEYKCLCGNCTICTDICPGNAIKNVIWDKNTDRDDLIDFDACRKAGKKRSEDIGESDIYFPCGLCMSNCPHTKKYLRSI